MSQANRTAILVAGLMLLVVLALWLPFGFIIPHHEPWGLHAAYETGEVPAISLTGIRSLHFVIPWLAYKIAPDSFLGYHALQIVGFWGKGFLLFLVMRRVFPQSPALAAAAGVLMIIFPADDAHFIMQATLHQIGLCLLLLSVHLYLLFRERRNPVLFAAMIAVQWASVSVYEAGLALMFVIPLLELWLARGWSRRSLLLSLGWIVVPTLWAVNIIGVFLGPRAERGYIGQVAQPVLGSENFVGSIVGSIWAIYPNHFVRPWLRTLRDLKHGVDPAFLVVSAVIALLTMGVLVLLRRQSSPTSVPIRQDFGLLLVGLLLVLLGFAMYLPTDLQGSSVRTYFYTAIGASIALVSFCYLVARAFRQHHYTAFVVFVTGCTFVALTRDLVQYDALAQHSDRLQRFLANILTTVPNVDSGTHLYLIGDESVEPNDVPIVDYYDDNIFAYLYGDYSIRRAVGHFNKGCINLTRPHPQRYANCSPGEDGIVAAEATGDAVIPYDRVVAVRFDKGGNTTLLQTFPADFPRAAQEYHPERLIHRDQPYPLHARTVLGM